MPSQEFFINNRNKIASELSNNTLAIVYSGKEVPQISDLEVFYPDNNYYYLTGLKEPDQLLTLYKDDEGNVFERLFIPELDSLKEKWVGSKISIEEAQNISGINDVSYNSEKDDYLKDVVSTQDPFIGIDKSQPVHLRNLEDYLFLEESELIDLTPYFERARLIKDKEEIELIQKAVEISAKGVNEILKEIKPGLKEYELAALFEYIIKKNGSESLSFPTITAAGRNGTILHYIKNNKTIEDNELVLFDLGGRYQGYCADISRTFPASGEFTEMQRKFYNVVLETQKELINHYKRGTKLKDIQILTKELFKKNLQKSEIPLPEGGIDEWYYHNIGHSLGLQTHDSQNRDLVLQDGMIITCEPGLYAQEYDIGIRIEDDILINGDNPIVLTKEIPKEIEEIKK